MYILASIQPQHDATMNEFSRGWKPLTASILGMACGIMAITFYTQGLFMGPVTQAFGWTSEQFFGGFSVMMVAGLFTAPMVGGLVDRYGPRRVGLAGLIGHTVGYVLLSYTTGSLLLWYASFGLLAVFAAGSLPTAWTYVVTSWFDRRRGLAIGVVLAASGLMAVIAPPIVEQWIDAYGWRMAYRILGLGALVLSAPVVWSWLRVGETAGRHGIDEAKDTAEEGLTRAEALKTFRFWALATALMLSAFAIVGPVSHLVPFLVQNGIPRSEAARIASVLGLHVILGRLIVGALFDRYWAPGVAALFLALPAPLLVLYAYFPTADLLIIGLAMTLGLAAGAELDIIAYLTSRYFGTRHYGAIFGALFAFFTVASGLAPALYGAVSGASGAYTLVFQTSAVLLAVAIACILSLGKSPVRMPA